MAPARESSFGDLLRRYRLAAGFTQEELAERAGLSVRGISDLERGLSARARKETLALLADALDLTPVERTQLASTGRSERKSPLPDPSESHEREAVLPRRHNLPLQLTTFVGRERALADLHERLPAARLLTLVGTGGAGKTRLALEVGA